MASTVETIQQSVVFVDQADKVRILTHYLRQPDWTRTLVFTRTKHRADKVVKLLRKSGIDAEAFHADKSQSMRQRSLAKFKSPDPVVLVATDIASRGLDVDLVSHVINFDLPVDAENYVHRIGRTGRAGAEGVAVSFCDAAERSTLQAIQRLTRKNLRVEPKPTGAQMAAASPDGIVPLPDNSEDTHRRGRPHSQRSSGGAAGGNGSSGQHGKPFRPSGSHGSRPATSNTGRKKRAKNYRVKAAVADRS